MSNFNIQEVPSPPASPFLRPCVAATSMFLGRHQFGLVYAKQINKWKDLLDARSLFCRKATGHSTPVALLLHAEHVNHPSMFFQGFSDFMFKWYMERGEYRKLLACCDDSPSGQDALSAFLLAFPKLAWMHQLRTGGRIHFEQY